MALRSAWEIALEKNEEYERLSPVTEQYLEHVAMLEECWDSIRPREETADKSEAGDQDDLVHRLAA
jgi:hypothetical protein